MSTPRSAALRPAAAARRPSVQEETDMAAGQWRWPRGARWARPRPTLAELCLLLLLIASASLAESIRLRHSRHLEPNSLPKIDDNFLRQPKEKHNHKPIFSGCSTYGPVVKEEQASGTVVLQVHAEDRDPPEEGGTITYSFVVASDEKLKFEINNITGLITTTQMLDRDDPIREKGIYMTVLATDNGKPPLEDVCTFKVIVEDINDNPPAFDKVAYVESVPQDLPIRSEVMRVSATDIDDGNNSVVRYSIKSEFSQDEIYFRIERDSGIIYLNRTIDKKAGYKFRMTAMAEDQGVNPQHSVIKLEILVVESNKKAPSLTVFPMNPIKLNENFNDYEKSIVSLKAQSNNAEGPDVFHFEIFTGTTEQTNKDKTFLLESENNTAFVKLFKSLDYERITEYTLIVRVQNQYDLAAEKKINIEVLDVNDNIPSFREIEKGSVLENEPRGTPVMQVRATDADGTSAHNQITYALGNYQDLFTIDRYTGNITTLATFDREAADTYDVKVIAIDNSPSALFKTGEPNKGQQSFVIKIADKNDNPPHFTQKIYKANSIKEDANRNEIVTEVKALDNDTESWGITYSITHGNLNNSFDIGNTSGKIRVSGPLDYEEITEYNLTIQAFDGIHEDTATVCIYVENVNDNYPKFKDFERNPTIVEETLNDCLTKLVAYDPDIKDPNADQRIVYEIVKPELQPLIEINKDGCMKLKKPLDRDKPNGYPVWIVQVQALDDNGNSGALKSVEEIKITLTDINDNAPFLDMPYPVIWDENREPGNIVELKAQDYDSDVNGAPFTYRIDNSADSTILDKFEIRGIYLYAKVRFDREERKSYDIPVAITDHGEPPLTGICKLTVIIGDKNDNAMQDGSSAILVYNYNGEFPNVDIGNVDIGRVYVNDSDDWDLNDKSFAWYNDIKEEGFLLNESTGMITMLTGTRNGTFLLKFLVTEEGSEVMRHNAEATVTVTVKEITKEAVVKSGSIRFLGISAEELVAPVALGISKKDILQKRLSSIFNVSVENVDVFTVLHSPHHNNTVLDVRFSAHGSPYYAPEKLNTIVESHSEVIAREMGADILLVNIDECIFEKLYCNNSSCRSILNISSPPYVVYTNTSSFVGVRAVVDPFCKCHLPEPIECLNGGTPLTSRCECPPGLEGPRCELLSIGFHGDGYAIMPSLGQACDESHLGLEIIPQAKDGLIFYLGPMSFLPKLGIQDFMSLELQNGNPVLYVDYGQGTVMIDRSESNKDNNEIGESKLFLADGKPHRIDVYWTKTYIEMKVDNCGKSNCLRWKTPIGTTEFLNVNSPLQIGGSLSNLAKLGDKFKWQHVPTDKKFRGCIRNMTINGNTYNLGMPALSLHADQDCSTGMEKASYIGIDTNFLVAIIVCITILLILLLAVVVHRRKTDDLYKDMDDIRENIINYEDEGGGEVDTAFDLTVLRSMYDAPNDMKINAASLQGREAHEVPDICGFLDGKKECCDKDPDTTPFDDVRHYAYEGVGNSDGSLSSLASCTDDGDLKFNYLSNFGPRFRKLADMYGEEPSDEESEGAGDRESESWC